MTSRSGAKSRKLVLTLVLTAFASGALAGDRRDVVFDCPCRAEWAAGNPGEPGTLTLRAGIRSLRASESGDVRLSSRRSDGTDGTFGQRVPARAGRAGAWTLDFDQPEPGAVVELHLLERTGLDVEGSARWHFHETLALWPVPTDDAGGPHRFVDILTDTDGDGVSDVNERLAGTAPGDAASTPGQSEIDVLALYTAEFRDAEEGYPYTRLLHVMNVTRTAFEDSRTNVRLRTVGMREVELGEDGWVERERRQALTEGHGADLAVVFSPSGGCSRFAGGCAFNAPRRSSHWSESRVWANLNASGVLIIAHELGHALGLAHAARQGESHGTWRWSRGHHVSPRGETPRYGTIMAYGRDIGGMFADPFSDCGGVPCGVPAEEIDGADAVTSLDRMRFQVAAHRAAAADSDGDGIVDAADAAPNNAQDWFDVDGDGIADNADPDDDNDGTDDVDDAFPLDPDEWADVDLDGIGDNTDKDVVDLSPFRDPALRAAVESTLGKPAGAAITAGDMASLTELRAWGRDIRDLTGLELATGLETLIVGDNRIDDLTPLSGLPRLRSLNLRRNRFVDLAPLSDLSGLHWLDLSGNPVSDISILAGLDGLRHLFLNDTQVAYADTLALPHFESLRSLGVAGLGVEDISALSGHSMDWQLDLARNPITDLSPVYGLTALRHLDLSEVGTPDVQWLEPFVRLRSLRLSGNRIADIGPLANMVNLERLYLAGNAVTDIAPLADMVGLETLYLSDNAIKDLSPLADMVSLDRLQLDGNRVSHISALSAMTAMESLDLSDNRIADIAPLADMAAMQWLDLDGNAVEDIAPLAGMTEVQMLALRDNRIANIAPLAGLVSLRRLYLDGNAVEDIAPLADRVRLETLQLADNRIADVAPLSAMRVLRRLTLNNNAVEDIQPLVDGDVFRDSRPRGAWLDLTGNPLNDASVDQHIPTLVSRGVGVGFFRRGSKVPATPIADPTLRALVAQALAGSAVHVDNDRLSWPIDELRTLALHGRGVAMLAGLESAMGLRELYAASNGIADLSPLAELPDLAQLDLRDNRIVDIAPLAANADLADGDWVALDGNPLSEESLNVHVPALLDRGVAVSVGRVELSVVAGGESLRYETAGYFEARLGAGVGTSAASDDPSLVKAEMGGGVLSVTPGARGGTATVTVEATGTDGTTATLSFTVIVRGPWAVPLFPSASDITGRQGFVRVVNRGPAGAVEITAVDDAGRRAPPLTLAVGAGQTVHVNSKDLESGNAGKGLTGSAGRGSGDWRLELTSPLDLDVLAYIRTPDGFLTAMHDVAPRGETGDHYVPIFNPASNTDQVSALRLVNLGEVTAQVTIDGIDDRGGTPGGAVHIEVPAGASVTLDAADLETGGAGLTGRLGDGGGKWRLRVASAGDLAVMNLLASPEGHLTNLSTINEATSGDGGTHRVPLFPSASDPLGRQGFVRVINRSDRRGAVRIRAFDDAGRAHETVTLSLDAGHVAHFNSDDLELGNPHKGLDGSTGPGTGDWRLELSSELDIEVLAYIRTPSGFLTSMHETVASAGRRYGVATFNPGGNANQVSALRIANPGSQPAHVSVAGVDDAGGASAEVVRIEVPAGAARTLTAADLESGEGLRGELGDGTGKWRLTVDSEQPVAVMSLLASPTGHLTNLSTVPPHDAP